MANTALKVMLVLLTLGSSAHAISRHDRVQVKPLRKAGQVVGFKLNVTLRPQDFVVARLGLGRSSVREAIRTKGWNPGEMRRLVDTEDKGYLRLKFGEQAGLAAGQPKEVEYEVRYGEGNDLKPGDQVDVFSAWRREQPAQQKYEHFFGVFTGGDHEFTSVQLP